MSKFKKRFLSSVPTRILKSHTFLQNFFFLVIILTVIFLIFSIIIFSLSKNVITNEYIYSSQFKLEETAQTIDTHISDIRYVISSLETNNMVQAFFFHDTPQELYDNYYPTLHNLLELYVTSSPFIDSVYLYSQQTDQILTHGNLTSATNFTDRGWLDELDDKFGQFQVMFRKKNDVFPYLLTVVKQIRSYNSSAAIAVNIDLRKLSALTNLNTINQSVYIVSDNSRILYRASQKALSEHLSTIPELVNFRPSQASYIDLIESGTTPYTYAQHHSSSYPWSYVLVTQLPEYQGLLSESQAIMVATVFCLIMAALLLAFLLGLRSVRPIQSLVKLFDTPETTLSPEIYNDREMQELSDRIVHYIHTNQVLSDELSAKLNLLNQTKLLALQAQINPHFMFNTLNMIYIQEIDYLGFEHPVPKLTLGLSRLLRYAIESTDLVSLDTELEFTKIYIELLQERHNKKPITIFNIDDTTLHAKVPKLFIQPIVENAVFHGLAKQMNDSSTLTITCHRELDLCVLSVKDNGTGMSPEVLQQLKDSLQESVPLKNSIGVKNVVTRMMLLFGDDFSIDINSTPGQGSEFILRFPFSE